MVFFSFLPLRLIGSGGEPSAGAFFRSLPIEKARRLPCSRFVHSGFVLKQQKQAVFARDGVETA